MIFQNWLIARSPTELAAAGSPVTPTLVSSCHSTILQTTFTLSTWLAKSPSDP